MYKIITDSCCDLTAQQYQANDVICVPLSVHYRGESHNNFSDAAAVKAFYDELRGGLTATTSAANPEDWAKVIRPVLEEGMDAVVITFSSAMSATYQTAVIAAQDLREAFPQREIYVVDSLCAALGQGLLVWYAAQQRDKGLSPKELAAWLEENRLHICHEVTVDDLDTLKRGGRISATTAFVGTMLNIKPMIHVNNEGKLINYAKARGRKAAMDQILKRYAQKSQGYDNSTVFLAHGDCPEDAEALALRLKEEYGVKEVVTGYVGPVIGAHTGPGVLVIFFLGNER